MSAPIAIVTGGSRGLGRDMVRKLAAHGTDVILTYRSNQLEADAVVAELAIGDRHIAAVPLNVGDVRAFGAFTTRVGEILAQWDRPQFDFLVNNAGHGLHASLLETTESQFDELVDVHFKGVFFLTQALLPLMADGGRIINISTGLTRFTQPGMGAYAAMKGAIEVLTRYMAKELGSRGIAVNTVAPGAIETDFGGGQVRDNAQVNAAMAAATALGRVGRPDDIGGASLHSSRPRTDGSTPSASRCRAACSCRRSPPPGRPGNSRQASYESCAAI